MDIMLDMEHAIQMDFMKQDMVQELDLADVDTGPMFKIMEIIFMMDLLTKE